MTVSVVTGKPGHGKTLYAVTKVDKLAKEQNRQVYYNGIEGLTLDWLLLEDATQWHNPDHVPDGAIVVIDEAQRVFPPRSTGSRVPAHVQPFDTHRHRGLDIYLITQDPLLIDSFARNLAGEHIHVLRPFGTQQAKVYRWEHVVDPDSRSERNLAVDTSFFRYPKESFDKYKSATVHTVKRKIPWKLAIGAPLVIALLAIAVTVAYKTLNKISGKNQTNDHSISSGQNPSAMRVGMVSSTPNAPPLTTEEYVKRMEPRVPDMPDSAPIYDQIATPSILPVLAGCIKMASVCQCYTQQGTRVKNVSGEMCVAIATGDSRFVHYDSKTLGIPENKPSLSYEESLKRELEIKRLKQEIKDLEAGKTSVSTASPSMTDS